MKSLSRSSSARLALLAAAVAVLGACGSSSTASDPTAAPAASAASGGTAPGGTRSAASGGSGTTLAASGSTTTIASGPTSSGCSNSSGPPAGGLAPGGRPSGGSMPAKVSAPAPTFKDVVYAPTSSAQKLDLYLPAGVTAATPLVIDIHGGAFKSGDKASEIANVPALLAKGYAVASVNYRLSCEANFPAGVQDVKAAVRWLRANAATYNLDPNRFAAWGGSAGGYMAAMLGATGDQSTVLDDPALGNAGTSSAVQAVVDWFGPSDFSTMDAQFAAAPPAACNGTTQQHDPADSPESLFLGAAVPTVPDRAKAASPITYLVTAKQLPPFKLAVGDADCLVPSQQSSQLDAALKASGASSDLTVLEGAGHGDPAFDSTQQAPAIVFLDQTFGRS